ncbi:hypothetical protein [Nocardioides sp. LML1-1-1.1]|uniref:hypothetical protein n=1 Tax=Nocardioides sp. LML1-1-1.1 TaxID=3135248 RepID=UPI00341D58A4
MRRTIVQPVSSRSLSSRAFSRITACSMVSPTPSKPVVLHRSIDLEHGALLGPREVDASCQLTVRFEDLVLRERRGESFVHEEQPGPRLCNGLGLAVGQPQSNLEVQRAGPVPHTPECVVQLELGRQALLQVPVEHDDGGSAPGQARGVERGPSR